METEIKTTVGKRLLITAFYVLLTGLVIGGSTWYVMDRNAKADKEKIEQTITELQNIANSTKPAINSASSGKEEISKFCTSESDKIILGSYQHVNNGNGDFVLCKIGLKEGSGSVIYGKKINNTWTKLVQTQQNPDATIANQYKIPKELFMSIPDKELYPEFQEWKY